jgi:hypothetical protein
MQRASWANDRWAADIYTLSAVLTEVAPLDSRRLFVCLLYVGKVLVVQLIAQAFQVSCLFLCVRIFGLEVTEDGRVFAIAVTIPSADNFSVFCRRDEKRSSFMTEDSTHSSRSQYQGSSRMRGLAKGAREPEPPPRFSLGLSGLTPNATWCGLVGAIGPTAEPPPVTVDK